MRSEQQEKQKENGAKKEEVSVAMELLEHMAACGSIFLLLLLQKSNSIARKRSWQQEMEARRASRCSEAGGACARRVCAVPRR